MNISIKKYQFDGCHVFIASPSSAQVATAVSGKLILAKYVLSENEKEEEEHVFLFFFSLFYVGLLKQGLGRGVRQK